MNVGHITGVVLLLVGIVLIARENFLEVIELPTIVSHVLSYARLVAVGLSGVAIAMVVNYMTFEMFINPALEHFTLVSIVMILIGLGDFPFRASPEHRTEYPGWRAPLDSFALC